MNKEKRKPLNKKELDDLHKKFVGGGVRKEEPKKHTDINVLRNAVKDNFKTEAQQKDSFKKMESMLNDDKVLGKIIAMFSESLKDMIDMAKKRGMEVEKEDCIVVFSSLVLLLKESGYLNLKK